jgi:hypothetical protein
MKMRMSTRRLEALISVACRGCADLEIEDDPETRAELRAAEEAIWYLAEWLREMKALRS